MTVTGCHRIASLLSLGVGQLLPAPNGWGFPLRRVSKKQALLAAVLAVGLGAFGLSRVSADSAAVNSAPAAPAAPAPGGYFSLQPVGSWSSLPNDSQCAAKVHYSAWEPRPENYQQNHTMPAPGAMAAAFALRPRDEGNAYNPLWDSWLLPRVDGQFTGTTDEILQWAACKWGLPDNLIRADAVIESDWFQYLHFPNDARVGGGGGGSCYWKRGCGDAFSSPTAATAIYCNGIDTQGLLPADVHDYQRDPVTNAGGYPYRPDPGLCPKTFSILGVMSWAESVPKSPYPAYPGNQNGTFPFTRDSTAAAVDYWAAYIRGCYEGWATWLKNTGTHTYAAGDLWGCIGSWFSGDWHSPAANGYIARVQAAEKELTWLNPGFDDSAHQYQCDAIYGCPKLRATARTARCELHPSSAASCGVPVERLAGGAAEYRRAVPDDGRQHVVGHPVPGRRGFLGAPQSSVDKRLLYRSPRQLESTQSFVPEIRSAEVKRPGTLLTCCLDGMPDDQIVCSQLPCSLIRSAELTDRHPVPGQEYVGRYRLTGCFRDQERPQSRADHVLPEHAEEAARLNRYPLSVPGPQMESVEAVQVFHAFCLADCHPSSSCLSDVCPYCGMETGEDPIRIVIERDHVPERSVADV
jgi:hypothetical protein